MNITGSGKVNSTVSGSNTIYTAIPLYGYSFAKWTYGGQDYTDNPITIASSVTDITVLFCYTISDFLKGKVGFDVSDSALYSILKTRGVAPDADYSAVSNELKDLLYADILYWGSTLPSSYGNIQDSDGGWTHSEGASTINAADKKRFASMAQNIYDKYQDYIYRSIAVKIVKL